MDKSEQSNATKFYISTIILFVFFSVVPFIVFFLNFSSFLFLYFTIVFPTITGLIIVYNLVKFNHKNFTDLELYIIAAAITIISFLISRYIHFSNFGNTSDVMANSTIYAGGSLFLFYIAFTASTINAKHVVKLNLPIDRDIQRQGILFKYNQDFNKSQIINIMDNFLSTFYSYHMILKEISDDVRFFESFRTIQSTKDYLYIIIDSVENKVFLLPYNMKYNIFSEIQEDIVKNMKDLFIPLLNFKEIAIMPEDAGYFYSQLAEITKPKTIVTLESFKTFKGFTKRILILVLIAITIIVLALSWNQIANFVFSENNSIFSGIMGAVIGGLIVGIILIKITPYLKKK